MTRLILYGTSACHLCEDAEAILKALQEEGEAFRIQKVDIADDDALMEKYGVRIPVIRVENVDGDLGWPFDESDVLKFLHREAAR